MQFSDAIQQEEPAYSIFSAALAIVFDKNDGTTEHLERLSSEGRLVYLVWCLDGEIHNGGFDQLFHNSLGNHSLEILEHLKTIGATKSWELLSRAIALFPDSKPSSTRKVRWQQLKTLESSESEMLLSELDKEFYKYEDNLCSLLDDFVRSHSEAKAAA